MSEDVARISCTIVRIRCRVPNSKCNVLPMISCPSSLYNRHIHGRSHVMCRATKMVLRWVCWPWCTMKFTNTTKVDGVTLDHTMQEKKLLPPHHLSIVCLSYKIIAYNRMDVPMDWVNQTRGLGWAWLIVLLPTKMKSGSSWSDPWWEVNKQLLILRDVG